MFRGILFLIGVAVVAAAGAWIAPEGLSHLLVLVSGSIGLLLVFVVPLGILNWLTTSTNKDDSSQT